VKGLSPFKMALAAFALAGLAWRLSVALSAPWYWDEGYVVELSRSLASFARPQVGAFWEDGFFPLTTSFIAPLSAMPFTAWGAWSPMTGARVWAVLLEGAAMGLLALLARKEGRPALTLAVLGAYALLPFAIRHGGRAFYHHFGVALALAAIYLGQGLFEKGAPARLAAASLCAGLAAACCYWIWWLPLSLAALLAVKRPAGWMAALPWAGLPLAAVLALNFWPDPEGAQWSVRSMLMVSRAGGPQDAAAWLGALAANFRELPFLALGLLGLAVAAAREGGRWGWLLFCMAAATFEPVRQRGDLSLLQYPFIMAAPFAALGAGYLAELGWRRWGKNGLVPAAALLTVFLWPGQDRMQRWCVPAEKLDGLKAFLNAQAAEGDLVCGLAHFNWCLRPRLKACEPAELGAAEGRMASYYLAGAPASRFATPCRLRDTRYAVVSRLHLQGIFRSPGVALTFLEMEQQGWPRVYDSPSFKVHENPRFGAKRDPASRILMDPSYYRIALEEARRTGRADLARFAATRLPP
jgi:hypothetical protein